MCVCCLSFAMHGREGESRVERENVKLLLELYACATGQTSSPLVSPSEKESNQAEQRVRSADREAARITQSPRTLPAPPFTPFSIFEDDALLQL